MGLYLVHPQFNKYRCFFSQNYFTFTTYKSISPGATKSGIISMNLQQEQTILISFFQFPPEKRIRAMMQMALIPPKLKNIEGLTFYKMLGTGGGSGYGFKPDFRTYALLTVWNDQQKALSFEENSRIMSFFRKHTNEIYSLFLRPIQSRGTWSRVNPFHSSAKATEEKIIVVLTRATLKLRYYIPFWKRVHGVSKSHEGLPGLIFSKGIGERPWIMQATFSVWNSTEAMLAFAYNKDGKHYEAVSTTKKMKGFKEELYARFELIETKGTWRGTDPVKVRVKNSSQPHKT